MQSAVLGRRRFDDLLGGGGSILTDRPPADQANLVWAWDPDLVGAAEALVGPSGTITTPTRTAGPPGFYTFAATDAITFGQALGSTFSGASGFTLYVAINPAGADLVNPRIYVQKDDNAVNRDIIFSATNGNAKGYGYVSYDGSVSNYEDFTTTSAYGSGKHTMTMVFDPSQSFANRIGVYLDGASQAGAHTSAGSGSLPHNGTAVLTVGRGTTAVVPVSVMSYVYLYASAHSAGTVTSNYSWINSTKGW